MIGGGIRLGGGDQVLPDLTTKSKMDPYKIGYRLRNKRQVHEMNYNENNTSCDEQDEYNVKKNKLAVMHPETIVDLNKEIELLPDSFKRLSFTEDSDQIYVLPFNGETLKLVWCIKDLRERWRNETEILKICSEQFLTSNNFTWRLHLWQNENENSTFDLSVECIGPHGDNKVSDSVGAIFEAQFFTSKSSFICNSQESLSLSRQDFSGKSKIKKSFEHYSVDDMTNGDIDFSKHKCIFKGTNLSVIPNIDFIRINELNHHEITEFFFIHLSIEVLNDKDKFEGDQITQGLVNEGTTCYINSMLQTLFTMAPLRREIFNQPLDECSPIINSLQRIHFDLLNSKEAIKITKLLRSFDWDTEHSHIQQDVMEFNWILLDALENWKIKNTSIFKGKRVDHVVCPNINLDRKIPEDFYTLDVEIENYQNMTEALQDQAKTKIAKGKEVYEYNSKSEFYNIDPYDEDYDANGDIMHLEKRLIYQTLPPVLQVQLRRFSLDMTTQTTKKINKGFEFDLDLKIDNSLLNYENDFEDDNNL